MGENCRIRRPSRAGLLSYKYKQYHSLVPLAIADADYTFISIDVDAYGREIDSPVLRNSAFGKPLSKNYVSVINVSGGELKFRDWDSPTPLVITADEASPLRHNLMKPYPRLELLYKQNILLSTTRRVVVCSFGLLTEIFTAHQKFMEVTVEKAELTIISVCVLHNKRKQK
jgi:hypothetical protein